jgi:phosphopantetheinyl transferase (holo-ACP synthase)
MPLAMSLEIVAEAAATLVPEATVTGLRDVRAHRWMAWDDAPQTLEVSARRLAHDRVGVELRNLDESESPCVEATVLLADGYPAPPAATAAPLDGGERSRLDPAGLYEDVMFHGPAWQAVRAIDVVAPAGATAHLATLPGPDFVLDPVVLDAAGQVIGFWTAERLDRARVVFPFRLAALDLYGPPLPAGRTLPCTAAIELVGDALVRSDIEVLDPEGRCWMRLTGWEDRRFDVPDRFRPLTRPSALAPLSAPWQAPSAGYAEHTVACRRLDARLPADAALWKGVWAGRVLGRREREHFAALRTPEGRQLEWLGARTAAKEAIAGLLRDRHGLDLRPADIEILPDERGCPRVEVPGLDAPPLVSLAHARGETVAFAALSGPDTCIGIDIERLQPRPDGFADVALDAAERSRLPAQATDEWVLRCWCAKEAAGKAVGSGLVPPPSVIAVDADRGIVALEAGGRRLSAHTLREGDLIVATVLDGKAGG